MPEPLTPSQENSVRLSLDLARALVRIRELEEIIAINKKAWAEGWQELIAEGICEDDA